MLLVSHLLLETRLDQICGLLDPLLELDDVNQFGRLACHFTQQVVPFEKKFERCLVYPKCT